MPIQPTDRPTGNRHVSGLKTIPPQSRFHDQSEQSRNQKQIVNEHRQEVRKLMTTKADEYRQKLTDLQKKLLTVKSRIAETKKQLKTLRRIKMTERSKNYE